MPVVLQGGMYGIIPQVLFRTVENDIPEDTGHAELVLILKIAATPLEYQHGNFILAGLYIWRYIKFEVIWAAWLYPTMCR